MWSEVDAEAILQSTGYLAVRWDAARIEYQAVWSNPLWEELELDPARKIEQVSSRIERTIASMPEHFPPLLPVTDASSATAQLPVRVSARLQRWLRLSRLSWQTLLERLWFPPWQW